MNVRESIKSALSSVLSNKMRSVLTMIGIIIGISSVILITSLGNGVSSSVIGEFEKLGMGGIEIRANFYNPEIAISNSELLTVEDKDIILQNDAVDATSVLTSLNAEITLKNPNEKEIITLMATDNFYTHIRAVELASGRFIIDKDCDRANKVVVIDENTSKSVFGRKNTVGETITLKLLSEDIEEEFTIIGIVKNPEETSAINLVGSSTTAFIPISTLTDITGKGNDNFYISVIAKINEDFDRSKISKELLKVTAIAHDSKPDKYYIVDMASELSTLNAAFASITAFISFVAAISLVVGGVGVMNIMLVTVTERTREIGIRKSLGATNENIQFQFLVESIILTAIGGIIGIILGILGAFLIGNKLDITPIISMPIILGVVAVSSLIGIVFGVYPANKAAKLDPIEALRYE